MFYTIYKITNQIDGKFYIGSHKTKDLNDNYMGSGKYLIRAQKKYGIENFKKEILFVFETVREMYEKEAELVNEDFLATQNTYNLKIGGHGGWDYVNVSGLSMPVKAALKLKLILETNPDLANERSRRIINSHAARSPEQKKETNERIKATLIERYGSPSPMGFLGKNHTEETKKKIGESNKVAGKGERNSQYGTRWIFSLEEKRSRKLLKDEPLPDGWLEGRKIKFD